MVTLAEALPILTALTWFLLPGWYPAGCGLIAPEVIHIPEDSVGARLFSGRSGVMNPLLGKGGTRTGVYLESIALELVAFAFPPDW